MKDANNFSFIFVCELNKRRSRITTAGPCRFILKSISLLAIFHNNKHEKSLRNVSRKHTLLPEQKMFVSFNLFLYGFFLNFGMHSLVGKTVKFATCNESLGLKVWSVYPHPLISACSLAYLSRISLADSGRVIFCMLALKSILLVV